MNEYERFQKLVNGSKAPLVLEIIFYLICCLSACFWWYGEPGAEVGKFAGGMMVVMLWISTFNHLPRMGLNCIKHPRAIFFQIPVSMIATIGFAISLYYT